MLKRGIDVKVAEMPLGKDPADIIREDAAEFKHIVGKSVHVIEFLLHVICREETDERTLKRRTRAEVLPFLLLLPDRIDQEHFVGVVAAAIGSTTEAVRFELDRLREQTKAGPLPHNEIIDGVVKEAVEKPDVVRSTRIYLEAAVAVIPPTVSAFVKGELEKLLAEEGEKPLEDSEVAGVTFSLEQQFSKLPLLAIEEEVISRLNHFRTLLTRRQLAQYRQLLNEAQESSNDELLMATLESIKKHEQSLRLPAYTVESIPRE
jgi:DNA primase